MANKRLPLKDPRTVAREIPGIFNVIFPQLSSGIVAYLNRKAVTFPNVSPLALELVQASSLQQAMLFELAYARCEALLEDTSDHGWESCLKIATERQSSHYDATRPNALTDEDKIAADIVATNLVVILETLKKQRPDKSLVLAPEIQGFQWIASGNGDFSLATTLVEVKCSRRNFGVADYRQVLMYWLLSYASALEGRSVEWEELVLTNPRQNRTLGVSFDEIIEITAAGKSKVEVLELFASMIGDYALKSMPEFRL